MFSHLNLYINLNYSRNTFVVTPVQWMYFENGTGDILLW